MSIELYAFLLLLTALSTDAFAAGLSYGIDRVNIPFLSTFIISLISSIMLTISLVSGTFIQTIIPQNYMRYISFFILLYLGINKIRDTFLRKVIVSANQEDFSVLSAKESFVLGLALSLDNIAAGIGTSLAGLSLYSIFILTIFFNIFAMKLGCLTGKKAAQYTSFNFSWVGAVLLFLLAFLRLL